ncbi:MAG: hypothetical protein LLG04_15930 [Parachlamydia sp.]|nr:hypothetical protein [Parachlamydia sp.]
MVQLSNYLQSLHLLGIFILIVLLSVLAYAIGRHLGWRQRSEASQKAEAPLSATVAAIMGLSAFMLAFTFGIAVTRFQERIVFVVEEANDIERTYLRAGYLDEPHRSAIRNLLREYISIRTTSRDSLETIQKGIERSEEIQDQLWSHGVEVARQNMNSEMVAIFLESLNDMIDMHAKRVTWGILKMPVIIWITLYLLLFLSMGVMGYHAGLGESKNQFAYLILILAFSCVLILLHDLDRPLEGFLKVTQQPLLELQRKWH